MIFVNSLWKLLILTERGDFHLMSCKHICVSNLFFTLQILDLVPILVHQYFQEKIPVTLSYAQASVLLCIGLQNQNISYIEVRCSICPQNE